ncbi:MAG: hypothetical protein LQ346_003361 [Caloplaca aetnensis]|nr:MAG: hypothetical protein LQ346_003361 [Caloplaca aetnensis]
MHPPSPQLPVNATQAIMPVRQLLRREFLAVFRVLEFLHAVVDEEVGDLPLDAAAGVGVALEDEAVEGEDGEEVEKLERAEFEKAVEEAFEAGCEEREEAAVEELEEEVEADEVE